MEDLRITEPVSEKVDGYNPVPRRADVIDPDEAFARRAIHLNPEGHYANMADQIDLLESE